MSIQLDWNVEAPDGEHQVDEDPAVLEARRRRQRFLRRGAIVLSAVLLAVSIAAWMRYRQVQDFRREMLIATVESEALALRIGDRAAFLRRQADNDLWRTAQGESFAAYQTLSPRIELANESLDVMVSGDNGSAVLTAELDHQRYDFTWHYEYTDRGWRHVASQDVPWEPTTRIGGYSIVYTYHGMDEALARWLEAMLGEWWSIAQPITRARSPALSVRLSPDASDEIAWEDEDSGTLVVPSTYADGSPLRAGDVNLRADLSSLLAEYWVGQVVGDTFHARRFPDSEIVAALRHQLAPELWGDSAILGPFIDLYGPEVVARMIDIRHEGIDYDGLDYMRSFQASYDAHSDRVSLANHLTALLRSEAACRAHQGSICPADTMYSDLRYGGVWMYVSLEYADASSVEVISMHQVEELVWAEVEITFTSEAAPTGYPPTGPAVEFMPFRRVNGVWVHSEPRAGDGGRPRVVRGPYVALQYYEQDDLFVDGLLAYVEEAYAHIASDFGMAERPALRVTIAASFDDYPGVPREASHLGGDLRVAAISPYLGCCYAFDLTPTEYLRFQIAWLLIYEVVGRQSGSSLWDAYAPVGDALVLWELVRLGSPVFWGGEISLTAGDFPESPLEAWPSIANGNARDANEQYAQLVIARTLIETVEEMYGTDGVAALVRNYDLYHDLDAWLYASLGIHADDIEPVWAARYAAERDALLAESP